jgi:hypothetical protein
MDENLQEPRFNWLTVVSIVVVLGLLAMVGIFLNAGRPHRNSNSVWAAIALESAINNFHTEYGVLPVVGSHIQTDGPDGVRFLNILLGLEGDSAQKQNPRSIKFLSVREAKGRRNGLQYDETGNRVVGLYDVWGNPFIVEINVKNEDKLRFKLGGRLVELPGHLAAAFSPGKDGIPGTPDDVTTW